MDNVGEQAYPMDYQKSNKKDKNWLIPVYSADGELKGFQKAQIDVFSHYEISFEPDSQD